MTPPDGDRRKLLRAAFRMPSAQSIRSRTSTVTNAFVSSIIPRIRPPCVEIENALAVLGMAPEDVRCVYCGDKSTEWDHLRPLVIDRRPTGFITEIANLVPACNKCNQSKRNANWRDWMLCAADRSPTGRGLDDVAARIARLEAYEQWRSPTKLDFAQFVAPDEWERYWSMYDEVLIDLSRCHELACEIKCRANRALGLQPAGRKDATAK